jgi:DNA-binding NtrC family response regulator
MEAVTQTLPGTDDAVLAVSEGPLRERLSTILKSVCRNVVTVEPGTDLWERLKGLEADFVVLDAAQVGPEDHARVDQFATQHATTGLVVVTEAPEPSRDTHLFADGVSTVVSLDRGDRDVRKALSSLAVEDRRPLGPGVARGAPEPRLADFHSNSPRMRHFLRLVSQVLDAETTLLVLGETGVGKEHLARAIHLESTRARHPFVAVNCGALPETLLESELFGHEKGAFTGAHERRRGRFEAAEEGTIFLDEVGEMPKSLQVKLLSVLQRREFRRVGGEKLIPMKARVIAATNRDLREDVEEGRFREDLFYRLNVVPLTIPPLRERPEDLPHLIGSFVRHFGHRMGRSDLKSVHPDALEALFRHDWPGNVRELINVVERAMLLARTDQITLGDLPEEIGGSGQANPQESVPLDLVDDEIIAQPLAEARKDLLHRFEYLYLQRLLEETDGVVGKTAARAGISPRSLYDKMKRHGLRKEDFKS